MHTNFINTLKFKSIIYCTRNIFLRFSWICDVLWTPRTNLLSPCIEICIIMWSWFPTQYLALMVKFLKSWFFILQSHSHGIIRPDAFPFIRIMFFWFKKCSNYDNNIFGFSHSICLTDPPVIVSDVNCFIHKGNMRKSTAPVFCLC